MLSLYLERFVRLDDQSVAGRAPLFHTFHDNYKSVSCRLWTNVDAWVIPLQQMFDKGCLPCSGLPIINHVEQTGSVLDTNFGRTFAANIKLLQIGWLCPLIARGQLDTYSLIGGQRYL